MAENHSPDPQESAPRGGDLFHKELGDITGGSVKLGLSGIDHISVFSKGANARISWDVKNGDVTEDQRGYRGPHGYDQSPRGGPF